MPSFYESQSEKIKMVIAGIFKEFTDLGNANTPETTLFYGFRRICSDHNEHKANVKEPR